MELDEKHRQRQPKKLKESGAVLVCRAKTDPAAAEELAALRAKEAEAITKKERFLQGRRDYYHKKKNELKVLSCAN